MADQDGEQGWDSKDARQILRAWEHLDHIRALELVLRGVRTTDQERSTVALDRARYTAHLAVWRAKQLMRAARPEQLSEADVDAVIKATVEHQAQVESAKEHSQRKAVRPPGELQGVGAGFRVLIMFDYSSCPSRRFRPRMSSWRLWWLSRRS